MWHIPLIKGSFTGAGLIVAIGPQNAFVLKQGLMKNHVFVTALFCAFVDAFLIGLGVGGLGTLITSNPILLFLAKWGGSAFLVWFGYKAFRSAFTAHSLRADDAKSPNKPSIKESLLILAAISLLNPHVYLDTVVLLGTIGSQFESHERTLFAAGAILSSFLWFFGLCYGARFLAPLFQKQRAWKILDFCIGCIMWAIALTLLI